MPSPLVMSDEEVAGETIDSASDLVCAETVFVMLIVDIAD